MNFSEATKQTSVSIWYRLTKNKLLVITMLVLLTRLELHIGEGIKLFKELFSLGIEHHNLMAIMIATLYLIILLFTLCSFGSVMMYFKSKLSSNEAKVADKIKPLL